jgi:hypothetical protein
VHSLADEVRVGSALADFHGLAPETVAARPAQAVAGEQLDRGRRAYPPPPYSPTALAAFSRKRDPSRM